MFSRERDLKGALSVDLPLSVVIPVYNAEDYLALSVGAILSQSFHEFELILVDDGSTDRSGEICEEYAKQDNRIKVYHKPNGGHSSAVNYGLERMTGKYVMICDTDDYYEPNAFEIAVNRIEASPDCDTVIFAIYRPDKEPVEDPASKVTFEKRVIDRCLLSGQTYAYCDIGFHIESTWAKIMRAEVIRKHHVRMPEHLFLDEDAVYCLHLFQHCRKVAFDSHHIYHYEIRYDSFCHKYSDVAVKMLPLILQEQERYLEKYHPNDLEYSEANDLAVFAWFNEAEEHYFFNENNTLSGKQVYQEYKKLLQEQTVCKHVSRIKAQKGDSLMRRFRLALYRHPTYPMFQLYRRLKKQK